MIHPYDPQAAMNAKYEALARKDADTARRLGPNPDRPQTTTSSSGYATAWRDDWMPATKETLMSPEPPFEGHPNRECGEHRTTGSRAWCFNCTEWCYPNVPCKGCELPALRSELVSLASRLLHLRPDWEDPAADEELRQVAVRLGELANGAATRAPQAAGDANGPGDDAGAAHDPHGGAAGHTALRDGIRDAFHGIAPDCVAYHAADCADCTTRADAVMAVMQAEIDAKDAEIEDLEGALTDAGVQLIALRQRAEAAEARLRDQNGHHT